MLARLTAQEAATLVRLSVFQGGFTLEAARAVAGVGAPLLAALDDRGVLDRPAPGRYAVLEMARQRLAPTIPGAVREAHAAYVAAFSWSVRTCSREAGSLNPWRRSAPTCAMDGRPGNGRWERGVPT
jgi:hypothetical protein